MRSVGSCVTTRILELGTEMLIEFRGLGLLQDFIYSLASSDCVWTTRSNIPTQSAVQDAADGQCINC